MPPEGSMRAGIPLGCPSLDRGSREAEMGFEPRTFRSVNLRSSHLAPIQSNPVSNYVTSGSSGNSSKRGETNPFHQVVYSSSENRMFLLCSRNCSLCSSNQKHKQFEMAQWLKHEFADRKVRGSNPIRASRLLLFGLGKPDSILALVLPSGGMTARHRNGATAERLLLFLGRLISNNFEWLLHQYET
ncbi:hypothetical protein CSKR_103198 [Clonorchis sinensis]|uniref:Uncharacterized protein n=1 Tax=Clonorchis sinensis TaxID=79923 RepID=A0A419PNE5_CLOSI|nr:hypothetical protein CSKR_103198 [Clonorchis sinensis]